MECGLPGASFTVSMPLCGPSVVGAKVSWTVQLLPAATLEPQLLVCAKSPLVEMLEMFNAALPELRNSTFTAPLVVPTPCEPKFTCRVSKLRAGAFAGLILAANPTPDIWSAPGVNGNVPPAVPAT